MPEMPLTRRSAGPKRFVGGNALDQLKIILVRDDLDISLETAINEQARLLSRIRQCKPV